MAKFKSPDDHLEGEECITKSSFQVNTRTKMERKKLPRWWRENDLAKMAKIDLEVPELCFRATIFPTIVTWLLYFYPAGELVKDFKCFIQSNTLNCSWIPNNKSLNLTVSYRWESQQQPKERSFTECLLIPAARVLNNWCQVPPENIAYIACQYYYKHDTSWKNWGFFFQKDITCFKPFVKLHPKHTQSWERKRIPWCLDHQ